MKRSIENRLDALEKKLISFPSTSGEIIVYEAEEGIPEELLHDKSIVRIFIPDNHRAPQYKLIFKKERERAIMRAKAKLF